MKNKFKIKGKDICNYFSYSSSFDCNYREIKRFKGRGGIRILIGPCSYIPGEMLVHIIIKNQNYQDYLEFESSRLEHPIKVWGYEGALKRLQKYKTARRWLLKETKNFVYGNKTFKELRNDNGFLRIEEPEIIIDRAKEAIEQLRKRIRPRK